MTDFYKRFSFTPLVVASTIAISAASAVSAGTSEMVHTASGAVIDLATYMPVRNGGRGGLPEVTLWFKKFLFEDFGESKDSWNYPKSNKPDNMHYTSWLFWEAGVSDALLQLFSEQATDPMCAVPHLGRYFCRMTNSGLSGWSDGPDPLTGMEVDISDTVPVTESCQSYDHDALIKDWKSEYVLTSWMGPKVLH